MQYEVCIHGKVALPTCVIKDASYSPVLGPYRVTYQDDALIPCCIGGFLMNSALKAMLQDLYRL